jgi:hypothetical protein
VSGWFWVPVAAAGWALAAGQWLTFGAYLKRRRRILQSDSREFADWYLRTHPRPRR